MVSAIITALGGRDAVQRLLGVGPSAISNYLNRGEFPARAKATLCEALRQRGYDVDPTTLAILPSSNSKTHAAQEASPNNQPHILLIVGGGIAAYKALEVARRLQDHHIRVTGVMTKGAEQFITPLSLAALTEAKAYTDLFSLTDEAEMGHIRLAREADLVLVVPATANLMARVAQGFASDLASTVMLATEAPILMAPAMNPVMWNNPATQANRNILFSRGVQFVGPVAGDTACGEFGSGRMSDPADIVRAVRDTLLDMPTSDAPPLPLAGRHAIVTSGPTYEPIDSVRFIANRSSGKQGHAIAAALAARGAAVTLVSGPVAIEDPAGVTMVRVETAAEMMAACQNALPADIAICAAAVGDWRVTNPQRHKIKKEKQSTDNAALVSLSSAPTLELSENPDILATLSSHANRPQIVVGFAAETRDLIENAQDKLEHKGCDWIIANHVASDGSPNVFGSDENTACFLSRQGCEEWPVMAKSELAQRLVTMIERDINNG